MEANLLMVPGMGNSGPNHWQTLWEQENPAFRRVCQRDWDHPVLFEWVMTLEQYLTEIVGPKVLVAHSLGCIIAVEAALQNPEHIAGALLVAPPDVEQMEGGGQVPRGRLPFPSTVAASENDPWVSVNRAEEFARIWGSRFVNVGSAGHINADSDLGDWPEGKQLFLELLDAVNERI